MPNGLKADWKDVSECGVVRQVAEYRGSHIAVENSGRYPKKKWIAWIGGLRLRGSASPSMVAAQLYVEDMVDRINEEGKTWPTDHTTKGKAEKT